VLDTLDVSRVLHGPIEVGLSNGFFHTDGTWNPQLGPLFKWISQKFSPDKRVSTIHLVTIASEAFRKFIGHLNSHVFPAWWRALHGSYWIWQAGLASFAVDISAKCGASFVPIPGGYSVQIG